MLSPLPTTASALALPSLGYDASMFELSSHIQPGLHANNAANVKHNFQQRVDIEKKRKELSVYYYRINHTLAFPLPLSERPTQLPPGIPELSNYPWFTWLAWALEERWRLLLTAWQLDNDAAAGELVQQELAALAQWSTFAELDGSASLGLGHIAGVLAIAQHQVDQFAPQYAPAIHQAATLLLERDYLPWYEKRWHGIEEPLPSSHMHNIPIIALTRSAQLARALNHPSTSTLEQSAKIALRSWCTQRLNPTAPHTEGTSYDGFLMDSVTEWLDTIPEKSKIIAQHQSALASLTEHWLAMTIPGRVDLQVPLSDVEPEMPFWINALTRLAYWYKQQEAWWLLQYIPPERTPAAAINQLQRHPDQWQSQTKAPIANNVQNVANAIVWRSGWNNQDFAVIIGAGQSKMSHQHQDSGHLILAWQNRAWITDPGYQQYRKGEERDFTIGTAAHNTPVIDGIAQSQRNAEIIAATIDTSTDKSDEHIASLNLTRCYQGIPDQAQILRHIKRHPQRISTQGESLHLVVIDELNGLAAGTAITISWQLGTHLAITFRHGWLRLSDGENTLWLKSNVGDIQPHHLKRHAGSRGPLTLTYQYKVTYPQQITQWHIHCLPYITWEPPKA